jgi:DNA-binding transcriptional MerR regulator
MMYNQIMEKMMTTQDVANAAGLRESTIRAYLARGQMPPPDERFLFSVGYREWTHPTWRPATIARWLAERGGSEAVARRRRENG